MTFVWFAGSRVAEKLPQAERLHWSDGRFRIVLLVGAVAAAFWASICVCLVLQYNDIAALFGMGRSSLSLVIVLTVLGCYLLFACLWMLVSRFPRTWLLIFGMVSGAVLKAVQCIEAASHGVAVHPRSGDLSYPVFNFVRCTQCKRCTEECPFGALDDDEKGTPKPNPARCRRCGTCFGACPERVISFANYNIDQIGSMIREVQVPKDFKNEGPRILILACENDAYPALDMAGARHKTWSPYCRVIPVRCLGSVNAIWVSDAMSKGFDGVMLLGCKYGDDYQCHFVKGSEICSRRKENIAETLNRLGVQPERVEQLEVAIDEYDTVPDLIDGFVDRIMALGPNPFKGM